MKLRLHKNSIRLRLSQPEVEKIGQGKTIKETLEIGWAGENNFSYSLMPLENCEGIAAAFEQNNLKIYLPKNQGAEWATSDHVGMSQVPENGVAILIEIDFQCLHKRAGEDESQNFPNPLAD